MAVKESRAGLDRFKMEVSNALGVNLKEGYNGDITSRDAGRIGGEMVKRMIDGKRLISECLYKFTFYIRAVPVQTMASYPP